MELSKILFKKRRYVCVSLLNNVLVLIKCVESPCYTVTIHTWCKLSHCYTLAIQHSVFYVTFYKRCMKLC